MIYGMRLKDLYKEIDLTKNTNPCEEPFVFGAEWFFGHLVFILLLFLCIALSPILFPIYLIGKFACWLRGGK